MSDIFRNIYIILEENGIEYNIEECNYDKINKYKRIYVSNSENEKVWYINDIIIGGKITFYGSNFSEELDKYYITKNKLFELIEKANH